MAIQIVSDKEALVVQMQTDKQPLYIFLDVDGVLNNNAAFFLNKETIYVLSHENLVNYQYLYLNLKEHFDVHVILSSTWRKDKTGINKLLKYSKKYTGLKFEDMTDDKWEPSRTVEIKYYCDKHSIDYDNVLVIDDGVVASLDFPAVQVWTKCFDGLQWSEVDNVLNYFKIHKKVKVRNV